MSARRFWRFYCRLWADSFGPMPARATFAARIAVVAIHCLFCLALIALAIATEIVRGAR